MLWLVIAAVVASAISLYYYLQVLKQIYSVEPPADCQPLCQSNAALWSIALLAGLVIGFGCAPGWLLGKLPSVLNAAMIPL